MMTRIVLKNPTVISKIFQKRITNSFHLDHYRSFSQTHVLKRTFQERDNRGDQYPPRFYNDIDWKTHVKNGQKVFIEECKLFWEEQKEKFRNDPKIYRNGDTDVFFRFDSKDCLQKWRVSSDKTNEEGFSECTLEINDRNKAVFSGVIDTTVPKDGKNFIAGYCGIRSVKKTKSFFRDACYSWDPFTHLELRVKGDGRNYMINLGMGMYFDINFFDMYTYVFYTHGGPYWQLIRIPFSKFYLASKARLQDSQVPVPLNKVQSVGITAGHVAGPFHLEIDYIGCHVDKSHTERFAYELYKIPQEYVTD